MPQVVWDDEESPQTEFERTSPDVAESKRAEQIARWGGYGETGAKATRDAALLALATLLTRGAGGGQGFQALARIGTGAGIGAAAPGSPEERARQGALTGAGTATGEALMAGIPFAGRLPGKLAHTIGRMFARGAAREAPHAGLGVGTGFKASDLAPTPLVYDAYGRPAASKVNAMENLNQVVPQIRQAMLRLRAPGMSPRPGPAQTMAKIGGSTLATEQPEATLGSTLAGLALLGGAFSGGRARIGAPALP